MKMFLDLFSKDIENEIDNVNAARVISLIIVFICIPLICIN